MRISVPTQSLLQSFSSISESSSSLSSKPVPCPAVDSSSKLAKTAFTAKVLMSKLVYP